MTYSKEEVRQKRDLVIDKLMHLEQRSERDRLSDEDDRVAAFNRRDSGISIWDWPQGVGLYGLHKILETEDREEYRSFLRNWYDQNLAKGLPVRNVNTTAPMLTLTDFINEDSRYRTLAIEWAEWLMQGLPRTEEQGFQHVTSGDEFGHSVILNENQLWIDTLFMTVLFLNKMAVLERREDWLEEAERQMLLHIKYLYDPHTGLFYHGWNFKDRTNFGGVFWCRGDAWFTVAVPDFLETSGSQLRASVKQYLVDTFRSQVRTLRKLQSKQGLWHTVLDHPESYEEVSGSAAITAGILKGIRMGILDESYLNCAEHAIEGLLNNIAEDGTVQNVSAGTPIGMDRAHYQNVMIAPMAYGQSLTVLALAEALRV